jgi:hypothetical protein
MGPSLLFHAQRGTLAKKHSHELMLSESCPSTYQQQIRNFDSLTVDVSVPTINTCRSGLPRIQKRDEESRPLLCGLTATLFGYKPSAYEDSVKVKLV